MSDQRGGPTNLAAIDLGTNSVHLVVARVAFGAQFEVLAREKEMVRLGSAGGDMKLLTDDAIDRAIETLARFRLIADSHDAPITAVATSAVREAENGIDLIHRAHDEAGVDVEVISGTEEARLIHLGVLQAVPVYERQHLVVDIGGGSTEIVLAQRDTSLLSRSLKLGAIRLTKRFLGDDPISSKAVEACARYAGSIVAPLAHEGRGLDIEVAVGSSGTIAAVAAMVAASRDDGAPPRTFNGFEFTRKEVRAVVKALTAAPTAAERLMLPGLDPKRVDIILAGAVILEQVMSEFGLKSMIVSDYALREGVLLDALERLRGSDRHHLHDVRRRSVLHLMGLCDDDPDHSLKAAELALALFDGTAPWHGLGDVERELLEAAALLANVGLFVSHAGHHKHTYYVIRNSEHLTGFTDHEIEVIAQVARYHRKSAPKKKHAEFAALDPHDQEVVRALAGLLRVAIALDRTHDGLVDDVTCTDDDGLVIVELTPSNGADLTLELYTADDRKGLLEEVLGRPVEVRARPDSHS
jgi:exopolyphosphatase/guanosine-5'-triphosphate,3'-diphosphate pyrophosphatase